MSDSNSYYDFEDGGPRGREEKKEQFWKGLSLGLAVAAAAALILTVMNVQTALQARKIRDLYNEKLQEVSSAAPGEEDGREEKIRLLEEYIDTYYYKSEEVTESLRSEGIYKGLVEALKDPYSVYYTAEDYAALGSELAGAYSGIGAYIGMDPDTGAPMITGVFRDSPAIEAGLDNGDYFIEVDGTDVSDKSTEEVAALVRGEAGTSVHLKMLRDGGFLEVDVVRRELDVPTVDWAMLDEEEGQIGYLQITQFTETTADQFRKGLEDLRSKGMEKMILDLRGNPGGTVGAVVKVAGELLPQGLVFSVESRNPSSGPQEYTCPGADFDIPLVVLVNGYSASASEILSGAIQDAGVGTVMGTKTFGKGVVQTVFELPDGSGVKLTIGKYFTRGGQDINEKGITPDVISELDADLYEKEGTDSQLRDAVDYLNREDAGQELNAAMAS